MKRGKATGLDGISTEQLIFCHPLLPAVLAKFHYPDLGRVQQLTGLIGLSTGPAYVRPVSC